MPQSTFIHYNYKLPPHRKSKHKQHTNNQTVHLSLAFLPAIMEFPTRSSAIAVIADRTACKSTIG